MVDTESEPGNADRTGRRHSIGYNESDVISPTIGGQSVGGGDFGVRAYSYTGANAIHQPRRPM